VHIVCLLCDARPILVSGLLRKVNLLSREAGEGLFRIDEAADVVLLQVVLDAI
jgi:hypothetical protein